MLWIKLRRGVRPRLHHVIGGEPGAVNAAVIVGRCVTRLEVITEFGERMQEFIRDFMTLFTPVETEYNAPLCEMIFEEMMASGTVP